ncbi:DUF7507 domain-containing protein, partial [Flavobacterium sp.]|uniref:DUF7507 domain-containing protein n=1 Tax=Flavobacterium sp. TaxID=239 RepID=UPI002FDB0173
TITVPGEETVSTDPQPGITLTKEGTWIDSNNDGWVSIGDTILFEFTVTNTGNVTLTDINITDDSMGQELEISNVTPSVLAPGQSGFATATYELTEDDIFAGVVYNIATVNASTLIGTPVVDDSEDPTPISEDSEFFNPDCPECTVVILPQEPSIALIKTATFNDENGDGYGQVGETITFNFTITNTGNVPLSNITITDPLPGLVLTGGPISLAPGETDSISFVGTYWLTAQDIYLGNVTNQALVSGTSPIGEIVEDLSDDSTLIDDTPTVLPITGCVVEVFNAITPNNDGLNDFLYIQGLDCYSDNSIEIYNRWGVQVFKMTGYNNLDRRFEGYSQGRATLSSDKGLPTGTYWYVLNYKDLSGNSNQKIGYIYIQNN